MTSMGLLPSLANVLILLLSLVLDLALLAVALTVVRKRSMEASVLMAASAVVQLLCAMGAPVVNIFVARLASPAGSMVAIITATQLVFSMFRLLSYSVLLFGIVKLANAKPAEAQGNRQFPSF